MPQSKNNGQTRANPAPLGLMGFGMTTVLLNLMNAGLLTGATNGLGMVIAMGIFYGGMAQIIAGILEYKNGNTFGTLAFCSYGLFWLSWVAIQLLPTLNLTVAVDLRAMSAYLFMWGIFTTYMFVGTLKMSRGLQVVFSTLAVLFFLLAAADFTGIGLIKTVAGVGGIFCGASAIYVACAQVLNEVYKKSVLPL